jgi:mediator of RNA polymerase II transcription subunit 27
MYDFYFRDVEQSVNALVPPPGPFNLGNTTYLGQETTQDRQALYSQLVESYKWTDKVCDMHNCIQILQFNTIIKGKNRGEPARVLARRDFP